MRANCDCDCEFSQSQRNRNLFLQKIYIPARYFNLKTAVKSDQADANGLIIYNANLEELEAREERILKAAEDDEFVSSSAKSPFDPSSQTINTIKGSLKSFSSDSSSPATFSRLILAAFPSNKTYGTHTTLYQRMKRWSSTSKFNGKT
jgi:uncharacterized protein (DUF885 family)